MILYVEQDVEVCNRREGLFERAKTDFTVVHRIQDAFMPHLDLWKLAEQYHRKKDEWLAGHIASLDGEEVPNIIMGAIRSLQKMMKGPFKEVPQTREICLKLKELYSELKPFLPIIVALKNIDFKQRHYEILRKCKDPPFEIDHNLQVSLNELKRQGIMEFVDELTDISETATKERQLEL